MKWLSLVLLCLSTSAFAQVQKESALIQKLKRTEGLRMGKQSYVTSYAEQSLHEKLKSKNSLIKNLGGQRLALLPQDNMPCLRPDMRNYRKMPNAGDSSILKHPVDPGIYALKSRKP